MAILALLFIALLAAISVRPAVAAATRLTAAVATTDGPLSTLSLSLSESVKYSVYALANPDRVVIDLPEVQLSTTALPSEIGLIGQVRTGRPSAGTSRLVIQCSEPVTIAATRLRPSPSGRGHLLTVSLRSAGKDKSGAAAAIIPTATTGRYAAVGWSAPPPRRRPADETADDRPSAPSPSRQVHVVVIDPGHGGHDPGAMTGSVMEKTITLATARELRRELSTLGKYQVVLTRDRDEFIPLRERIAIARRAGAELMVSIHANKLADDSVRGLSVYTLSERASDTEAAALAESENKADVIGHLDLRDATPEMTNILIDLSQRDTMNSSIRLASLIVDSARRETRLLAQPHRFAGFAVLKAPDVPSVLLELGFLSNRDDVNTLTSPNGRRGLVRALARGVDAYFQRFELANRR